MTTESVLNNFIADEYPQIHCEKCEKTFLTNVYHFDETNVLLEKRSLGLEYYCGAIHQHALNKVPKIKRVGILDEYNSPVDQPTKEQIYSGEETDHRFIYIMEKLKHLNEEDSDYFDRCVKNLEWQKASDRKKIFTGIEERYNSQLAEDIMKLFEYYSQYEDVLAWDLHGDNLMQRLENNEIVILDPYTRRA